MTKRISVEQMPEVENDEQMRHLVRYVNFINSRPERALKQRGFATHHIYPRSLAKKNSISDFNGDWNLVELTHREHFIAHMILFYCGYKEMIFAFNMILHCNGIKINSRIYEKLRFEFAKLSHDLYFGKPNKSKGKIVSEETKYKLKLAKKDLMWVNKNGKSKQIKKYKFDYYFSNGWVCGSGHILSNENNPMFGKHHTEKTKEKIGKKSSERSKNTTWMNNGKINKYPHNDQQREELLNEGFIFGRINPHAKTCENRICVHKGDKNKTIQKDYLQKYLNDGFELGRTKNCYTRKNKIKKYAMTKNGKNKRVEECMVCYYIDNGWDFGHKTKAKRGSVGINNGEKFIFVHIDELDDYILNGWKTGRIKQ
jgi:hypothetical protein